MGQQLPAKSNPTYQKIKNQETTEMHVKTKPHEQLETPLYFIALYEKQNDPGHSSS